MATKNLSQLCRSVLPDGFDQVVSMAPRIQAFLEENLPEGVNKCVTLLTINTREIVIAANSPMVTNYLRLHGAEIQQQLRETFALEQPLKFCSLPASLLKLDSPPARRKSEGVSAEAVESISRSAAWIEDEKLKAALLSLAESLKKPV
tara:strand:+ start:233 stop:676 length:444 start_codon:yes stop_codon:yes gene_type:complete